MTEFRKIELRTGVTLNVGLSGPADARPVILLHGFPESHRTWRRLAPHLEQRFRLIMPDLRGFGGSDRAQSYAIADGVDDLLSLADALGASRFALIGHDIGGVIAWTAAQAHGDRIDRLAIINAPHPFVFQKSLIEHSDQRRASQYVNAFKLPGAERLILADLDSFFDQAIAANVAKPHIAEVERAQYLAEWSQPGAMAAMLGWYRGAKLIVPPPGLDLPLPDAVLALAGKIHVPTLILWGMADRALLPVQLDGLDRIVDELAVHRLAGAGHFVPWEAPEEAARLLEPFLAGEVGASAQSR